MNTYMNNMELWVDDQKHGRTAPENGRELRGGCSKPTEFNKSCRLGECGRGFYNCTGQGHGAYSTMGQIRCHGRGTYYGSGTSVCTGFGSGTLLE